MISKEINNIKPQSIPDNISLFVRSYINEPNDIKSLKVIFKFYLFII